MFTKTTLSDLKGELRTFAPIFALSCFTVVNLAYADEAISPLSEGGSVHTSSSSAGISVWTDSDGKTTPVIVEGDFKWLDEESEGTSAWYGIENNNTAELPSDISIYGVSSEAASSSSLTPMDISLSSSSGITKTYDGTSEINEQITDLYFISSSSNVNVGGLSGNISSGTIVSGYNVGPVIGKDNVGGLVGLYDGNENHVNSMETKSNANNTLQWESFNVADGGLVEFSNSKESLLANGVEDGVMGLENRHVGPAASVTQFSMTTSGRSVLITGAKIGSHCVLLNAQGRVVASTRIASANFVVNVPRAGTYFVRIDGDTRPGP